MHEGVAVGELDGHHCCGLLGIEQGVGHRLDGHGGGPLLRADEHRPVPDHMDVRTFDDGC